MSWQAILTELVHSAHLVSRAAAALGTLTAEQAWEHPGPRVVREKLLLTLNQPELRPSIVLASQAMQSQYDELLSSTAVSDEALKKLGVLSAAIEVLTSEELSRADTPKALFIYTMTRLAPWVEQLARLKLLETSSAPLDAITPSPQLHAASDRAIHPTGDLVARDLNDRDALLGDLVATTRMLTEILHRAG